MKNNIIKEIMKNETGKRAVMICISAMNFEIAQSKYHGRDLTVNQMVEKLESFFGLDVVHE